MTFQQMINRDTPTLVDFYASWCGPCRMMAPILDDVKRKIGEKASIIKVDVDASPTAANVFQVQGVPTLILFRNGKPVWRKSGVVPASEIEQVINNHT